MPHCTKPLAPISANDDIPAVVKISMSLDGHISLYKGFFSTDTPTVLKRSDRLALAALVNNILCGTSDLSPLELLVEIVVITPNDGRVPRAANAAAVLRPWTIAGRARKTGQIHDTDPNLGPLSIAVPGDVTVVFDGNAGLVTGRTGDGVLGHEGLVPARIVVFHLGNSLLDSAGNG